MISKFAHLVEVVRSVYLNENNIVKPKFVDQIEDAYGNMHQIGRREQLKQNINHTQPVGNIEDVKSRLNDLISKYGFRVKNILDFEKKAAVENTTALFRGHKTLNPFIKSQDTKSPGNTVFWAKQPNNALTFSVPTNTGGTAGRFYSNSINKIFHPKPAGYISIAIPKNQNIEWRGNMGIEQGNNIQTKQTGFKQSETALGVNDISKLRTYIACNFDSNHRLINETNGATLLNVNIIKKHDPNLYSYLLKETL